MMTIDERRDSPRIPVVLSVRFGGAEGTFLQTTGTVSLGGVDFVAPKTAPKSEAAVELKLPAGRNGIKAKAVPIHDRHERGHRRISASFVGLNLQTELHLARWLQRISRNKPPAK